MGFQIELDGSRIQDVCPAKGLQLRPGEGLKIKLKPGTMEWCDYVRIRKLTVEVFKVTSVTAEYLICGRTASQKVIAIFSEFEC